MQQCILLFMILCTVGASALSAAIFTIQRNDQPERILNWYLWHARLVNASDIYVIDHQSSASGTTAALAFIHSQGSHVVRGGKAFNEKHSMLTDLMTSVRSKYRLLIPLDLDEYLTSFDPVSNAIIMDKRRIRHNLNHLSLDGRFLKMRTFQYIPQDCQFNRSQLVTPSPLSSSLHRPSEFFLFHYPPASVHDKTIFDSSTFVSTDQGNHFGVSSRGLCNNSELTIDEKLQNFNECFMKTNLALLHLNVISFADWKLKMISRAKSYGCHLGMTTQGTHYCDAYKMIIRGQAADQTALRDAYNSFCRPTHRNDYVFWAPFPTVLTTDPDSAGTGCR